MPNSLLSRLPALAALAITGLSLAQTPAPAPDQPPAPDPNQQFTTTTTVVKPVDIAPSNWKPGQPIKDSDDLLSALENADATFRSLQADLRKTKIFGELEGGGTLIYDGKVMFISEVADPKAKPRRMFQVDFLTTTADGVKRSDNRTFVFDGQLFVERQPDVKQVHKRQIVPPGQTVDPLAIGEGPFPIPIGQKRERILQRFTATLLPSEDFPDAKLFGGAPDSLKDTYQLKLIPRATAEEAQRYKEVRIWYRKSDLLPRIARTVDRDDAINVVTLMRIQLNQPLPPGAFDTSIPKGWDAQIDEFRAQAPAPAPENTLPVSPKSPPVKPPATPPTPTPPKNR
jgi:outer membrane lipoprotein-sorting protein